MPLGKEIVTCPRLSVETGLNERRRTQKAAILRDTRPAATPLARYGTVSLSIHTSGTKTHDMLQEKGQNDNTSCRDADAQWGRSRLLGDMRCAYGQATGRADIKELGGLGHFEEHDV
jgi:hypothetical protein